MKKIKKIAQSIGVVGKILNSESTSQENTYSCDYINKKFVDYETLNGIETGNLNLIPNSTYLNEANGSFVKCGKVVQIFVSLKLKASSNRINYVSVASGLQYKAILSTFVDTNVLTSNAMTTSNNAMVLFNGDSFYVKTTEGYSENSLIQFSFTYITND